jgi:hypothetical protein
MYGAELLMDRKISARTTFSSFMKIVENPCSFDKTFKKIILAKDETIVCLQGEYFKYNVAKQTFTKLKLIAAAGCNTSDVARQASIASSMKAKCQISCKDSNGERTKMLFFKTVSMPR